MYASHRPADSGTERRELYVGPWLPEPITDLLDDLLEHTTSADTRSLGFLRVLETATAVERAVLLLHDVVDIPFAEIAADVGRAEAATRQIAHGARACS